MVTWCIRVLLRRQAGDGVVGDDIRDMVGRVGALGPEPLRGPVERAEKGARGDGRIGGGERSAPDALGDQRAHAALVPIALGDDERAQAAGEGVDLEMRGGALDLVDETQHVREGELPQPQRERPPIAPRAGERAEQPIERAVLTEEQQFVLAAEVVIEVPGGEVGGDRDVAHAGGGEAPLAEDARRRAENVDAPRLGAL
jgi:hypothetical protein